MNEQMDVSLADLGAYLASTIASNQITFEINLF